MERHSPAAPRLLLALLAAIVFASSSLREVGAAPAQPQARPAQALCWRRVDIQRLRLARRASVTTPGLELPGLVALVDDGRDPDVRTRAASLLLDSLTLRPGQHTPGLPRVLATIYVGSPDTVLKERALLALLSSDLEGLPAGYRGRFLAAILPQVLRTARTARIPPSVTLAQAILESGWGRSRLAREHHNLFGVKATDATSRVTMPTLEAGPDGPRSVRAAFRAFDNPGEAIAQHAALLSRAPRYAPARARWTDWRAFLAHLAPRYATDPHYAERVADIIQRYHLDRWDVLIVAAAEADQA